MAKAAPKAAPKKKTASSKGAQRTQRKAAAAGRAVAPPPATGRIKVRATQMGFYDLKRRREGDVFFIKNRREFSERWMEVVEGDLPLKETGAQEALDREHDRILGGTAARNVNAPDPDEDDDTVEQ